MKSFVLFNNKGGVGKTTLTFNIAHMLARQGHRTVVLDYDPQCNLSALFLDEDALFDIWQDEKSAASLPRTTARTVAGAIDLVRRGKGDVRKPELVEVAQDLWLLPGHLALSRFEQQLAEEWPKRNDTNNERALDVTTALDLLSNMAAEAVSADIVMLDVGPSLGALNRSALLACDAVVVPLAPDLFSLQGLENIGPILREWRDDWTRPGTYFQDRPQETLPIHTFQPIGYIVQQHITRADRMPLGHQNWAERIPTMFRSFVLDQDVPSDDLRVEKDDYCIARIKHFASLVPLAQVARKPLFDLKQADGIGGGTRQTVVQCRNAFEELTTRLLQKLDTVSEAKPFPRATRTRKTR